MGYLIGGGGRVGVVTVIGGGGSGGRGGTGGSGGGGGTVTGGGGTVTGGGGSTGGGGTGAGTVTPTGGGATAEAIVSGGGGGEAPWVGNGTLLGAPGWTKRVTRVPGAAPRSFSLRATADLPSDWILPAEALFCPGCASWAFA
jgi:hypothetical protein